MTQEDKQLLLVDLCARLPYGVKITDGLHITTLKVRIDTAPATLAQFIHSDNLRYYLRPMSSMTEEESTELSNIISEWFDKELFYLTEEPFLEYALSKINYSISTVLFDWLNKKMFDFRGLIPKGLAISTEEFNPYKD